MNYLMLLASSFIINIGELFCIYKIVDKKINLKSMKTYIVYIAMVIIIFFNYIFSDNLYKVLLTLLITIVEIKVLFNKNMKKTIIAAVLMQICTIIAELFFSIFIVFLNNIDNHTFAVLYQGAISSNLIIAINLIVISLLKFPNILYKKICNVLKSISINKTLIFLGLIVVCSSFLFYMSYYNNNKFFSLFVNFLIVTVYFIVVIMIIKKENNYNRIKSKYVIMIDELKEYERIINEYRIINHENKNQLLSIKGMTKNKKVNDYINEIVNNKSSKNQQLLNQALLIPTGGLRGLIYSKLIQMKELGIYYMLNIDKKINNKLIKKLTSSELIDICHITGVFLDNAIEAVKDLNEKKVIISIYEDDSLNIEIINNYNSKIDINKIDKVGYTTKSSNHGYGLALVNKILEKNKNFSNEREVSKNLFKQKLKIKL